MASHPSHLWEMSTVPPYNPTIHIAIINSILKQTEGRFVRMGRWRKPNEMMILIKNFLTEEESTDKRQICGGWDHYSEEGVKSLDSTGIIKYAAAKKFQIPNDGGSCDKAILERRNIGLDEDSTNLLSRFLIDVHVSCNIHGNHDSSGVTWSRLLKIISHYITLLNQARGVTDEGLLERRGSGRTCGDGADNCSQRRILYDMIDGNEMSMDGMEYKSFSPLCSKLTDEIIVEVFPEFVSKVKSDDSQKKKDDVKDYLKSVINSLD